MLAHRFNGLMSSSCVPPSTNCTEGNNAAVRAMSSKSIERSRNSPKNPTLGRGMRSISGAMDPVDEKSARSTP